MSDPLLPSGVKTTDLVVSPGKVLFNFVHGNGAKMLALCKFVWLRKQMTEVTYIATLLLETILSNLEKALSET